MIASNLGSKKFCILYFGQPPLASMILPNGSRPKYLKEIEQKR